MLKASRGIITVAIVAVSIGLAGAVSPDWWRSTRVSDPNQHLRTGEKRYPYRAKSAYILKELDLKPGDVVVDIGAGDGWWSQRMAECVGEGGLVYAAEIEDRKVTRLKEKFADAPQIKPHLCKTDSTELPENSCDLVFLSQTYHHLDKDGRIDYLRRLRNVVKTTGRLCVIEKYTTIATEHGSHGTALSRLIEQAEQAGWIPVRCELMTGTYHYIAIFVQKDLFGPEPSSLP
ncbi:MAG: class I SAM-dependent methyltransferase [Phycisphaerae bacterium]|nr:class I SAM-dependent methyltransferase [Phycisphaerae bacterium]